MKIAPYFFGKLLLGVAALALASCSSSPQLTEEAPEEKSVSSRPAAKNFEVIAYYTGYPEQLDQETLNQLTHIIYSFAHLKGNKLVLDNEKDSLTLSRLVALKKEQPDLKIMVALGGWGGCETCSEVFSTAAGRQEFAQSTKALLSSFGADGLDLDWEYPTIAGYPEHPFKPADKENFSLLVQELRNTLGNNYELSFAAGGFTDFLEKSVNWQQIMPLLDRVNLMSYDLVNGNSALTGHHTPLFSTKKQLESADNAIRFLDSLGIPLEKVVIGAAFYARVWEQVPNINNGLYQQGQFKEAVHYQQLEGYLRSNPGFRPYWDSVALAPYLYNPDKKLFATFDDEQSIARKTEYAIKKGLGGIMFWQLSGDKMEDGLLDTIHRVKTVQSRRQ